MWSLNSVCVFLLFVYSAHSAFEGDPCSKDGLPGVCRNINRCQAAIEDIRNRKNPQICTFSGTDPVVCCVDQSKPSTAKPPVATTSATKSSSTTEYEVPVYDYKDSSGGGGGTKSCAPLPASKTSPRNGRKAWDKCIEYQEKYVYPCKPSMGLAIDFSQERVNRCGHKALDDLIVGGVDAARREFPHMVLLGFGDDPKTALWQCGGTLISDKYILTAGHCTSTRESGQVAFAFIGALKRSDQMDTSRVYKIKRVVKGPGYTPPSKYNDIALLETEKQMVLSEDTVPACLHIGDQVRDSKAIASGWGDTEYKGSNADNLQKVTLEKFTTEECGTHYPVARLMKQGVNESTQVCYGDRTRSRDTCQGDSGGPLQIKSRSMECMYTVVAVTSFGRACGVVGQPGIYTRVAPFLPWIESVVWPN